MKNGFDKKANYGLYALNLFYVYILLGISLLILCIVDLTPFIIYLFWTIYMTWAIKKGRFIERDRLLDLVSIKGDENLLDIGCGRGLVLIGAAKRLSTGKAVGVDIWDQNDQAGNRPDITLKNAKIEGVSDRIEVLDGDARKLPFDDGCFDIVTSSLAIHNIKKREERFKSMEEIVRVLKPNGRFALLDIHNANEYANAFKQLGIRDVKVIGPHFLLFPPVKIVVGNKA